MKKNYRRLLFAMLFMTCSLSLLALNFGNNSASPVITNYIDTQDPIKNKQTSLQAFDTILQVLKHPRCINCHPVGDRPRQGDDQHLHLFNVQRGEDNHAGPVQKCSTCHHEENNPYTNVPGAPHWGLAPKSMGWFGLSDSEIAQRLTDTTRNGGRTTEDLVHHMTHDKLVLWAWNPGGERTPIPISFENFEKALHRWADNGAYIPE